MRIMLIAPNDSIHSMRFFQMLLDAGHTVVYLDKRHNRKIQTDSYCLLPYPKPERTSLNWIKPSTLRRFIRNRIIARKLREIWEEVEPEVVHVHLINMHAYQCILAKLHPLVLTVWGTEIHDFYNRRNKKEIIQAIKLADHITADTEDILKRCETLVGQNLCTSLYYYGVDLELFRLRSEDELLAYRQKLEISEKSKIVLSIRRLIPKMGHHYVLIAFSEAIKNSDLDAKLIFRRFYEYSHEYENELKHLAKELGVIDHLIWMDQIEYDRLPILYSLADLIVNFPERDGLPVSLFEASACMTPVVTTDLEEYQRFLSKGAYFRLSQEDVPGLTQVMSLVLNDKVENINERLITNYNLVYQEANQISWFDKMERIYLDLQNK